MHTGNSNSTEKLGVGEVRSYGGKYFYIAGQPHQILECTSHNFTALQVGRSRVRFPMGSLRFFTDLILPVTLRPWGRLSL